MIQPRDLRDVHALDHAIGHKPTSQASGHETSKKKIKKDKRIHDLFGCYSANSGKVFYRFPDMIGEIPK